VGLFAFAWIAGEGLIIWRWIKNGAPPAPGALLLPSGVYVALAVLAHYQPAQATAAALAWGFDAAVLLQVVGKDPKQVTGWPPQMINDPSVFLPSGGKAAPAKTAANTAGAAGAAGTQLA
jgi:hypothetical protein